jgi:HEAT repeat protein
VLLAECDVPARSVGGGETLLDINWVPLYEDWEAGIKRILSVIKPIPPEIQNLISALRSEDRDVRDRAFKALHKIGDPSSVPGLIEALKDEDFRKTAAKDIRKIGPEAKAAVSALVETLKDEKEDVRWYSAKALKKINTPEALKALEEYRKKSV